MTDSEIDLFNFEPKDRVLFVGEGNFSFSYSILKYFKNKSKISQFQNVYVTCYQKELSPSAMENASSLRRLGAEVLLDVDATKLDISDVLCSIKFDKIVFNFPHVGGKMKIHLNRDLLKRFFISASRVLAQFGKVVVTLCSGQGGTCFDNIKRRWDDSWQIVEQGAHGNFILSKIGFFPHKLFPDYKPVGYRGREQVFGTDSAVIHYFIKKDPIITHFQPCYFNDLLNFQYVNEHLLVSSIHKFVIDTSPLNNPNSPQIFLYKMLENSIKLDGTCAIVASDLPYHVPFCEDQALCLYKNETSSLRSNLIQVIQSSIIKHEPFLVLGLVFAKPSSDFSHFCAKCHCVGRCSRDAVSNFFSELVTFFKYSGLIFEVTEEELEWNFYFQNEILGKNKVAWGDIEKTIVTFDLDLLCSYIFNASVRQLWSPGLHIDAAKCTLILPSLYPLLFCHDISFSTKVSLKLNEFYHFLHQLPNNIIESVSLVSTYYLSCSEENSYCFRLTYRSFNKPLNRKLAIEYHENIVGKGLELILNVRIR